MDEFRHYLELDTVFKRSKSLNQSQFTKNFFPEQNTGGNKESDSSSGDEAMPDTSSKGGRAATNDSFSIGGSSLTGSIRTAKVNAQIQLLDKELRFRLGNAFTSVRKAWLALDDDGSGSVTAEHFAKFLGGSGVVGFDFTLMEILVKMHSTGMNKKLSYNEFT